ncbi:RHS repeat-associated core domain-containing protein [Gilliamella sp. WF3-4]|uniref:RHS repeat-associated core domain-containing protein n=1 Tax=Gilliamella sp. WF3-4 TaxID=3120255 RepID=UPI00159EE35A|nr:RHS repeat-associated core domain-containing protein [Gilliamella apicola]
MFQTNLWQGSRLIAETDNDKHWQSYLYEPDSYRPLALVHGNAQQDNIKLYWYQNDHLGTPIALTGSLGDTLYECQYNAYGQIINETHHQDDIDSLPNNPLRFQGQYYDEETGLHYNLNRYYDPFIGRYITQDPLGILGGLNSYQYAGSDPINWIDPLGLIKVADKGVEGIIGKEADTQLVPDTFVSDVTTHNKQLGVINRKQGTISGAHNQDAFLESIEITGAKIVNPKYTDRQYPGLIEYEYQIPAIAGNGPNAGKVTGYKGVERKTTYDPAILSDAKVAEMSNKAAHQAKDYFQSNPTKNVYDIKVDGYWFRVTHDPKTNKINNAFLTMPPRSIR